MKFLDLSGVYEPSAIQQLPDGRFLVVEDEKQFPFSLVSIGLDGQVSSTPVSTGSSKTGEASLKLDDLEALALDPSGYVYALTSHSRDGDGDEKKSRDKLVRFQVDGQRLVAPMVIPGLKRALADAHPVLAAAAQIRDVKDDGGLNIEALEISQDQQQLLIGFRSPLQGQHAIIASVENPAAMFESGEPPRIAATLQTLDLGGDGIRGMAFIPGLQGYLLISGPAASADVHFGLWFWSGLVGAAPRRVTVPGLPGFEHAEGVTPAVIDGQQRIVIVSDDGSRETGRCARFLLLDPGQLQIAP
ncbi:MAG: DUF3616 domain-containing protein [Burkholderiales bacterium]|nr:DUF3616 domain-containing protein [Burkholderiales bacterium]